MATSVISSSVNDGRRAPMQGFDTSVYIMDQASGTLIPLGELTGFQHTIRNATEPYLPLGNRSITLLDGEFQIGWVAEQGKLNLDVLEQLLGFSYIGPTVRIGRSPRFQIVVEYNAPELDEKGGVPGYVVNDEISQTTIKSAQTLQQSTRATVGRYIFGYCKIDAYNSGIMSGRAIIADRIEGLAEYWNYQPGNVSALNPAVTLPRGGTITTDTYIKSLPIQGGKIPSWVQTGTV